MSTFGRTILNANLLLGDVDMGLKEAREHLDIARKQWDHACSDSWAPEEPESCVTNAFYAYENLIVATAEAHGLPWQRNHYKKAELATDLAKKGILTKDLGAELLRLNDLRKDVSYGEPGADLRTEVLEDLVTELEHLLEEVEDKICTLEAEAEEMADEEVESEDE